MKLQPGDAAQCRCHSLCDAIVIIVNRYDFAQHGILYEVRHDGHFHLATHYLDETQVEPMVESGKVKRA